MAFHGGDDEDMWKCPNHPSRRRQSGVCHSCLRDRLLALCPDCASVRPCLHSSSSSRFFPDSALRRSRSLSLPFLRSRPDPAAVREDTRPRTRYSSLWSVFKTHKTSKCAAEIEIQRTAEMRRSKSVVKGKGWHFPSPFRQSPMCRGLLTSFGVFVSKPDCQGSKSTCTCTCTAMQQ